MSHDSSCLFLRLSKWANRQGENFLTEAFVLTLQALQKDAPAAACAVVSELTDGFLSLNADDARELTITTQATISCGRPDLVLRFRDRLVYVEVKDFAGLGELQLERYLQELRRSGAASFRLVVLSRYAVEHALSNEDAQYTIEKRWSHVGESIERLLETDAVRDSEPAFLATQFVHFLEAKGLLMHKVQRIDSETTKSLVSLCALLEEAAASLQIPRKQESSWTWMGLYLDKGQFNVGIHLNEPEVVEFTTAQYPVAADSAERICEGELFDSEWPGWSKGPYRWRHHMDLAAKDGDFYAVSKTDQRLRLETFIKESRAIALALRATE